MDLAVASTVGLSMQIILFILPVLVLVSAYIGKPLGIFFRPQGMAVVIVAYQQLLSALVIVFVLLLGC